MDITSDIKQLIRSAIREDLGSGDVTTRFLIPKSLRGSGVILVKQNGILAGQKVANEVFRQMDSKMICRWIKRDGQFCKKGSVVARIEGSVASIVKAERVALNFLSHLSGIATLTYQFVKKVKGTKTQILDTRKTLPLWRSLQKYAVRMGGGVNHRMGLWDRGLVKDNHWEFVNDADQIASVIRKRKKYRWIVELTQSNFHYIETILKSRPSMILLDNFRSQELKRAVQSIKKHSKKLGIHPLIEASGGIQLGNVRAFAKTGVDRISIGALTHSVPALDFSLEITKVHS